jgi:hypothetical protein
MIFLSTSSTKSWGGEWAREKECHTVKLRKLTTDVKLFLSELRISISSLEHYACV